MAPTVLSHSNSRRSLRKSASSSSMSFNRYFKAPPARYLSPADDDFPAISLASSTKAMASRKPVAHHPSAVPLAYSSPSTPSEQDNCTNTCGADNADTDELELDTNPKLRSKRDRAKYLKEKEYIRDPTLAEVVDDERCARCARNGWRCFVEADPNSPRMVCRPCGKNKCSFGNSKQRPNTKQPPPQPAPAVEAPNTRKHAAAWADEEHVDKRTKYEAPSPLSDYSARDGAHHGVLHVHPPRFEYEGYRAHQACDHSSSPNYAAHSTPRIALPPVSSLISDLPLSPVPLRCLTNSHLLHPQPNLAQTEPTNHTDDASGAPPTPTPSSPASQTNPYPTPPPSRAEWNLDILVTASEHHSLLLTSPDVSPNVSEETGLHHTAMPRHRVSRVRTPSTLHGSPGSATDASPSAGTATPSADEVEGGMPLPNFPYWADELADDEVYFRLVHQYASNIMRARDRWFVLENMSRWDSLGSPSPPHAF